MSDGVVRPAPKSFRPEREPKPLKRGKRINPRKPARLHERFQRAYLDPAYVALVKWKGCVVGGCWLRPVHACHRISRGAGGTWRDLFGACWRHHAEQHSVGVAEFERRYGLDLEAECAKNVAGVGGNDEVVKSSALPVKRLKSTGNP